MKIYFSHQHAIHSPETFVRSGQLTSNPETPARADALLHAAQQAGHQCIEADFFDFHHVRRVHDAGYLHFLEHAWMEWNTQSDRSTEVIPNTHPNRYMQRCPQSIVGRAGYYQSDTACPIGSGTWKASHASAGCALSAAQAVMKGATRQAYALCRPPGHHAFTDMAGGFCFLNNTAIAAQYCLDQGARRVAIVDVDVHHGNGTQSIFYARSDVLTVSLHGDPNMFYPFFCGYADETGEGEGAGFNLNIPLDKNTDDDTYLKHLQSALKQVDAFSPDVLIIALGLDTSGDDPLAFVDITTEGFRRIGAALGKVDLPTILVQEGGYMSGHLGNNLVATLAGFEASR